MSQSIFTSQKEKNPEAAAALQRDDAMLSTKIVKSIVMMTPEEVKEDRNRKAAASLSLSFEGVIFLPID